MGISLLTAVAMARILGPEGRGFYAIAATAGLLGVQFGTLGLHTSNAYFVASKPDLLPALTGNTLVVGFGLGGLIAAILGTILIASPRLLSIQGATLFLALLSIPFGLTYALLQNLMLGAQDIRGYNVVEIANAAFASVSAQKRRCRRLFSSAAFDTPLRRTWRERSVSLCCVPTYSWFNTCSVRYRLATIPSLRLWPITFPLPRP